MHTRNWTGSTDLIPIYVIFQCILHLSNEVRLIRLNMLWFVETTKGTGWFNVKKINLKLKTT